MLPEPVETDSSTRPLTVSVRSNVASEASEGTAASAIAAVAAKQKSFILIIEFPPAPSYAIRRALVPWH
jgi:hypothetical protein